jgi:multidrug efflux pump subunit AcrA (membrane-fusion protein)
VAAGIAFALMPELHERNTPPAIALVRQFPVLPPDAGRVASVNVVPGQHVRAGDTLAIVEIPGLTQQVAAAAAAVRGLEEELAADSLDMERKLSKDADATRARLLAARVDLADAEADLTLIETDLGRYSAQGVGTSAGVIDNLKLQQKGLQEVIRARRGEIAELQTAWNDARRRSATGSATPFQAQLEAARAEYEALAALKEACVVRAHVDGVVGLTYADQRAGAPVGIPSFAAEGQWVDKGTPLMALTEAVTADAVTYVSPSVARGLTPGQAAVLVSDSGAEHAGEIVAVGGAVEPLPLRHLPDPTVVDWGVPVTVRLTERTLLPGEQLVVRFLSHPAESSLHNVDVSADSHP